MLSLSEFLKRGYVWAFVVPGCKFVGLTNLKFGLRWAFVVNIHVLAVRDFALDRQEAYFTLSTRNQNNHFQQSNQMNLLLDILNLNKIPLGILSSA